MTSVFEVCSSGQMASWNSSQQRAALRGLFVIWLALVLKAVPSDQVPANGGVPTNVARIEKAPFAQAPPGAVSFALTTFGATVTLLLFGPAQIESRKLVTEKVPAAVTGRSTARSLVVNVWPSFHVPLNGGFPLKRGLPAVPLQSLRRMLTSTVGLSQANVPSTTTCFVALLEHWPALTTTLMSMGLVPVGLMTTESPVAVAGVPFAIVHFAVAGGVRSTRAVKEDSMFVAAGATIVASLIVQSTRYAAVGVGHVAVGGRGGAAPGRALASDRRRPPLLACTATLFSPSVSCT